MLTKTMLCAVDTGDYNIDDSIKELAALCEAAELEVAFSVVQKRDNPENKYYLGEGKLEEAKQDAKKIIVFAIMVAAVIGVILFAAAPFIHYLYSLTEDAKEALRILVRIRCVFLPLYIVHVSTFFVLRAGGDTLSTLLIDSGFLWVGPVLVSTVLSLFTEIGLIELFFAVQLLEVVKMFFAVWLLKKGRWVRNLAEE